MSHTIDSIAAMIPPHEAQIAVAKVLAALGGQFGWNSDTTANVADAVAGLSQYLPGIPPYIEQDEGAVDFWRNLW